MSEAAALKEETTKAVTKRKVTEPTIITGNGPTTTHAMPQAPSMLPMVQRFMTDSSVSIERANQAFDFYQRVQAEAAQKAYLEAKAAFKAVAPAITKDKENKQYGSTYASIGNVVNVANEALSKHGLDASWNYDQGDKIKVTCILRHVLGHSESVSLTAPPDASGSKNPLQQIKSTLTYLKLATFEAVTGIATKEGNVDDDGNASGTAINKISADDVEKLRSLIMETQTSLEIFYPMFEIECLEDMPQAKLSTAINMLEIKKKAKRKA